MTPILSFITAGAAAALLDVWWIQAIAVACAVVAFLAWLDRYTLRTERERWQLVQDQRAGLRNDATPYEPVAARPTWSAKASPPTGVVHRLGTIASQFTPAEHAAPSRQIRRRRTCIACS